MKKLHKKIGAVALASMIVAGGVGASKIDSHALWWRRPSVVIEASNWDLSKLSKNARIDADYLKDYLHHEAPNIKLLAASDNKQDLDEYISKRYPNISKVYPYCFYGRQVVGISNSEKIIGKDIAKVKFGDAYVLVSQK